MLCIIKIVALSVLCFWKGNKQDTINRFDSAQNRTGYWEEVVINKYDKAVYEYDTILHKGCYINGKRNGLWKGYYFPSNKISYECYYKDNKYDSLNIVYFKTGEINELRKDLLNNIEHITYYINGDIKHFFEEDSLHIFSISFNEEKDTSFYYKWNKKTSVGFRKDFFWNNKIHQITNYLNENEHGMIEHGKEVRYYDNGQIEYECISIDGLLEGDYIQYNRDGSIKKVLKFKNGREVYD
jgi:antitoxin component YwqK of YwqJK toxin-antitoxin module